MDRKIGLISAPVILGAFAWIGLLAGCGQSNDTAQVSDQSGGTSATTTAPERSPTPDTGAATKPGTAPVPAPEKKAVPLVIRENRKVPTVGATGPISDETTVQAVERALKADKGMAGAKMVVTQQAGTVDLKGVAKTPEQKDLAEKIVADVQKKRHVQVGVLDELDLPE